MHRILVLFGLILAFQPLAQEASPEDNPYLPSGPAASPAKASASPDSAAAIDTTVDDTAASDSAKKDSVKGDTVATDTVAAPSDTAAAPVAAEAVAVPDTVKAADPKTAAPAEPSKETPDQRRQRIVRETTVNTIDELKGQYRSPKKALFMSLLVPGLGQAYVGNYYRAAAYILADVAMVAGWRHYVVVKHDRQVRRYRAFADENWTQAKYEDSVSQVLSLREKEARTLITPHRDFYCGYVIDRATTTGNQLYTACADLEPSGDYTLFRNTYDDSELTPEERGDNRGTFYDVHQFYELVGKEQEFVAGWSDANDVVFGDSSITGGSELRGRYVEMRAKATDYSRMQVYFLGGIVLNHIISAVDAALSARYHNRALYQTEVSWYDRIRLESVVGRDSQGFPVPYVSAHLSF